MRLDEYFGFTDREVREMLSCYGLDDRYGGVKNWYDDYLFGETEVYCPWDVIRYCADAVGGRKRKPGNYWSNTSGNDVIRHFIEKMGNGVTCWKNVARDGYSDIFIYMEDEDTGAVIEVKYAQDRDLETACRKALLQIDQNGYVEELRDEGCRTILKYGMACYKKTCRVAVEKEIL